MVSGPGDSGLHMLVLTCFNRVKWHVDNKELKVTTRHTQKYHDGSLALVLNSMMKRSSGDENA